MRQLRWILVAFIGLMACGGDESMSDQLGIRGEQSVMKRQADGTWTQEFDVDGDGKVDVTKVLVEYPDADDPSVVKTRLQKKMVDVNFDGKVDFVRNYNEFGAVISEDVDLDLDGNFDVTNHIDNKVVVQKDMLGDEGKVIETRYYANGEIQRVEKDTTGDAKIDYWEFYEQGILDRIGRDANADGRADSWTTR